MELIKRMYGIPSDILDRFERVVRRGERSQSVARLMHEWLLACERDELRRVVIEGCREMSALYRDVDKEWSAAGEEVERRLEA